MNCRGVSAPVVLVLTLIFLIIFSTIAFLTVELSSYQAAVKQSNLNLALKNSENLELQPCEFAGGVVSKISVANKGGAVAIITHIVSESGSGLVFAALPEPVSIPVLDSKIINVDAVAEKIGVLTSNGNVFWLTPVFDEGTVVAVPSGQPVYVTFTIKDLPSTAAVVLTVDGVELDWHRSRQL
ncbi:MAG: hypothetical protein QW445_07615 [Candidatus Bathyarchaeia archaeon]